MGFNSKWVKQYFFQILFLWSGVHSMSPASMNYLIDTNSTINTPGNCENKIITYHNKTRRTRTGITLDSLIGIIKNNKFKYFDVYKINGDKIELKNLILNNNLLDLDSVLAIEMKGPLRMKYFFQSIAIFGTVSLGMGLLFDGAEYIDDNEKTMNQTLNWSIGGVVAGVTIGFFLRDRYSIYTKPCLQEMF